MVKTTSHPGFKKGLTLIEVMLSILLLTVVVIGTSGYRYLSAIDARRAEKQAAAARIALLLNESWRGQDANSLFDPIARLAGTGLDIQPTPNGASEPGGFTLLKNTKYRVVSDNAVYFATMSYQILDTDPHYPYNPPHRRIALSTILAWPIAEQETSYASGDYTLFTLTTYAETGI